MRQVTELFEPALGLERPWRLERTEFDEGARQLDLYVDFERGGIFPCPECGREGCKAYDTKEKSWRHLDFFQHRAFVHARAPRIECPECGVKQAEVPWARPGSGFTFSFEALVMALARATPVKAIARLVGEHDTRLWRVIHHYVRKARAEADFSGVRSAGLDDGESSRA